MIKCSVCQEVKKSIKAKDVNGSPVCYKCNREQCHKCGEYKKVEKRIDNEPICKNCYISPSRICCICNQNRIVNKNTKLGPICKSCYKAPRKTCNYCGKLGHVEARVHNRVICKKCYRTPEETCSICHQIKNVCIRDNLNNPICKGCYKTPLEKCTRCHKTKHVWQRTPLMVLCHSCYVLNRLSHDERFYIETQLRKRVRAALQKFSQTGKIASAKKYNINYDMIINHLGVCPGKREEYHIDHILPLSAFDLNNPLHIYAAFHPSNHQWLPAEHNLSKNAKYDPEVLEDYLDMCRKTIQIGGGGR